MSFAFPEIHGFKGLFYQRNSFTLPDGALEDATNVNVSKDGILSSRRGLYTYFTPVSGTLNRVFNFNENLVSVYSSKAAYYTEGGSSPNETGTETALSGATVTVSTVGTSRSVQANSNLYFTSDNGPIKLSAYNGILTAAGAPQALDVVGRFIPNSLSTWFSNNNSAPNPLVSLIVGYRVVFGYTDANGNLILGAPSDIITITNTAATSKSYTSAGAGPYTITVTSTAHGLPSGMYLTFANGGSVNANGTYKITVVDANTFTYSEATGDPGAHSVDYQYAAPIRIESSIPSEITTANTWFYQVYRSSQQLYSVGIFDDFQLVQQTNLTSAQISAGVFFFTDTLPDVLRGANLYTNENSAEGEAQANYRPPMCLDMTYYKGYVLYGNCTTRQFLALDLVDSTVISAADYVEVKISSTTRRYVARSGVGNQTVIGACSSSAGLLITYVAHGFSNGDYIYCANQAGGSLADGFYYVIAAGADTFKISLTNGGAAVAYSSETSVEFQGVTNGTYPIFYFDAASSLPSVRLYNTAHGLVKAINRDSSSLIYANYISGVNDVPGQMQFQAKGFGAAIYVRANSTTSAAAFSPVLPTSFNSGTQVYSLNSVLSSGFYVSKLNEPEAVPLVNFFSPGASNKDLLRIVGLRDSVIIIKKDGIFKMTGDVISNFAITILDSTVHCVAPNSVDVINNQVALLSNQGVCLVTESSVEIISRSIEDKIQPILGQSGLAAQTFGVAYETERLYLLTTTEPDTTTANITWAYNVLTLAWTKWDELIQTAVIGPDDVLYTVASSNVIKKERKKQTRIDFTGQNYSCTLNTIATDGLSGTLTISGYTPAEGDVLVKNSVITWITGATLVSGTTFSIGLNQKTNLAASDSLILYSAFTKTVKLAPYHGGLVGRLKVFSKMLVHCKDQNISKAYIYFANNYFAGSQITTWTMNSGSSGGWGNEPWGFFPWGDTIGTEITQGTLPAPVLEINVPSFAARCSFLQPYFKFMNGADMLNMQAISFTLRTYGERITR
jgi:hypothetical protein